MTIYTAEDNDMNQVLDVWSRRIPLSTFARPLSLTQVTDFFQTSRRLDQLRNASTTPRIITELISEKDLHALPSFVKLTELSLTPTEKNDILLTFLVPFLEVITHKDVLYSMLLEQVLANVYVFLPGRRATALFSFLADVLQEELNIGDTNGMYSRTLTALTALLGILECNQIASLLEEFHHVVETLNAFSSDGQSPISFGL